MLMAAYLTILYLFPTVVQTDHSCWQMCSSLCTSLNPQRMPEWSCWTHCSHCMQEEEFRKEVISDSVASPRCSVQHPVLVQLNSGFHSNLWWSSVANPRCSFSVNILGWHNFITSCNKDYTVKKTPYFTQVIDKPSNSTHTATHKLPIKSTNTTKTKFQLTWTKRETWFHGVVLWPPSVNCYCSERISQEERRRREKRNENTELHRMHI